MPTHIHSLTHTYLTHTHSYTKPYFKNHILKPKLSNKKEQLKSNSLIYNPNDLQSIIPANYISLWCCLVPVSSLLNTHTYTVLMPSKTYLYSSQWGSNPPSRVPRPIHECSLVLYYESIPPLPYSLRTWETLISREC